MALIHPFALRPGDTVAAISPSGPVLPELIAPGVQTLESWGLKVRLHESVFARRDTAGYLAGEDPTRLESLRNVFLDPEVNAVFCSRGGYGAMRLLPALAADRTLGAALREAPKLLVGFSDITALHLYFAGILGVATLHGPVLKSFGLHTDDRHQSLDHLRAALFGERGAGSELAVEGLRCVRPGRATGPVFGGNLSLVTSLIASPFCPDLNGAIIILEDVGEEDYRLDRLFTTLRLAEKSARPAAIVLGDFTGCAGAYVQAPHIHAFVDALACEFDCPVAADFPFGHAHRNVAIPMGTRATLDAAAGRLVFARDAVG